MRQGGTTSLSGVVRGEGYGGGSSVKVHIAFVGLGVQLALNSCH